MQDKKCPPSECHQRSHTPYRIERSQWRSIVLCCNTTTLSPTAIQISEPRSVCPLTHTLQFEPRLLFPHHCVWLTAALTQSSKERESSAAALLGRAGNNILFRIPDNLTFISQGHYLWDLCTWLFKSSHQPPIIRGSSLSLLIFVTFPFIKNARVLAGSSKVTWKC